MDEPSYTFRGRNADGSIDEVELTREQAETLAAGGHIAYAPHDERLVVEDDGTFVFRESAVPRTASDS